MQRVVIHSYDSHGRQLRRRVKLMQWRVRNNKAIVKVVHGWNKLVRRPRRKRMQCKMQLAHLHILHRDRKWQTRQENKNRRKHGVRNANRGVFAPTKRAQRLNQWWQEHDCFQ
jgi:hypothetical protein